MTQVPPFVGREQELEALARYLDEAGRNEGRVVLIAGEAGVGKSRLLAEAAARARASGWLVLAGRAYETEGMPPYLPFVEAIRGYLDDSPDNELFAVLKDLPEIAILIPELRDPNATKGWKAQSSPEIERIRLFDGVSNFLLSTARSPASTGLLLVLDDLHWADRSTVLLLLHLARKLKGAPVVVAGSYRPEQAEKKRPLFDVLAEFAREHLDEQLTLDSFSRAEIAALVEGMTGRPPAEAVLESLQAQTGGNPFFVEELTRQLQAQGRDLSSPEVGTEGWTIPDGIRAVIGQRVSRLSPEARSVLNAGAVHGDGFTFHLVSFTSGLSAQSTVEALEEATAAALLQEGGSRYNFSHPLFRQVLYESLSLARREQLHARTAESIEGRADAGISSDLAAIGHHWRLGGYPEKAIDYLLRAGDAAIGLTAWTEAAAHWEAATRCMHEAGQSSTRRARLLEGIGDLYFLSNFGVKDCVERYEQAAVLYESAGDRMGAARARSRSGRSLAYPTSGFDYPAAVDQLRIAEEALRNQPASVELGEIYAALAHAESHALRSNPNQMLIDMKRLKAIADELDNDFLRIGAYSLEGHYLGLQGHLAEGLALEQMACDGAQALSESSVNDWPVRWRDFLLAYSSEDDQAIAGDAGSFVLSRWYGRLLMTRWTAACCGLQSLELSDPVAARAPLDRIRDPQGRLLNPFLLFDLFLCGDIATLRRLVDAGPKELSPANQVAEYGPKMLAWCDGRWDEAESFLAPASQSMRERGSNSLHSFLNRWLIRIYRVNGNTVRAREVIEESLLIAVSSGAIKFEFPFRNELALLLIEEGHVDQAEQHIARLRDIQAAGEDWRGLAGRLALTEGAAAAARGEHDVANAQFDHALDVFRRFSLPWDEAEAYEVWARAGRTAYRGRSRRAFVSEKLDAARAVYKRIDAGPPWLVRLNAERDRLLGERTTVIDHPDDLTVREVEVLNLIAQGKSNRAIAERLVISTRTVERHITNLYAKIGARGKADATAYALKKLI